VVRTIVRRLVPVAAVAALAVAGTSSAASAAAAAPPHGQLAITALYDSTELAVSGLQKAPDQARVLAAKLIFAEARLLLKAPDPSSPGTVVGGLDLDAYCQSTGDAEAYTPYPGVEHPGGAYTWVCVSGSGAQTPINLQAACDYQYPGQVTIAYPQDPDNSYSYVCLAPVTGSYTDSATGTTVTSVTAADGDATLITSPDSSYLAVDDDGNSATVVQDSDGAGYMSFEGSTGGSVLTYDGSSGSSV
jgi:hypothetical protein